MGRGKPICNRGTTLREQVEHLLSNKDATQRAILAQELAARLDSPNGSVSDRRAAEELARQLAEDAVQLVREELSKAVRHCQFLPHDIAVSIAHDVDAVACPFLQITEIFSEDDWRELVQTVSQAARMTIAGRPGVTEGVVESLVETGDICVAATLIRNARAPICDATYSTLLDRFEGYPWVLELMVARTSLPPEIAYRLVTRVSDAARERLAEAHGIEDFTNLPVADARANALIRIIGKLRMDQLAGFASDLYRVDELGPAFLLQALNSGLVDFFEAAMAVHVHIPVENVRTLIRSGDEVALAQILDRAQVPDLLRQDITDALQRALVDMTGKPAA